MARKKKTKYPLKTDAYTHDDSTRPNIPTAEMQSVMEGAGEYKVDDLRYSRRNPDLDPQLVWRGKDAQNEEDLVVPTPPLFIQEKIHPKALVEDLRRDSEARRGPQAQETPDLFEFFQVETEPDAETEFYQHDANWSNRMILGDALQVMGSLAEREGLRGKVQCIYIDPPYGIKFNSNFQWSTTSRDVKDGKKDHISREPEQVKAFRDTWRDGIHSYLSYLRDRLIVARDLLTESGSIFVQIGDENVHRVRALMDEVFGSDNFISQIVSRKTTGDGAVHIGSTCDYVLWFCKRFESTRSNNLFSPRSDKAEKRYRLVDPISRRHYRSDNITSSRPAGQGDVIKFRWNGREFTPGKGTFKTREIGLKRLGKAARLLISNKGGLNYRRYSNDFGYARRTNLWDDISGAVQSRTDPKVYVVQSSVPLVERCILLTTLPGDIVLDPTCGSGTSAMAAEQWGRRWITIDTSRVALALARARLMGARYSFYLLSDSKEGRIKEGELSRITPEDSPTFNSIKQGFVYERVPHITLKSIANNTEIDVIWEQFQEKLEPLREALNKATGESWEEWEIPREADTEWSEEATEAHTNWWKLRIERQQEIDASIAAKADYEYLYDKPYVDKKKIRVAGPFTVESLSPHRTLTVDENDELIDQDPEAEVEPVRSDDEAGFAELILENLKVAGVQQTAKEDRIRFTSLTGWPGNYICAEARYVEGESEYAPERKAGIFIGPEFGTVSRMNLVEAAREAADAGFDVLIACAFNYDAHADDFNKLGKIQILKATMNADLHMADELKNTGAGNLFVIFGEPDVVVAGEEWLVDRFGKRIAPYELFKLVSGTSGLAEIHGLGAEDLSRYADLSCRREVWDYLADAAGKHLDSGQYRRGAGPEHHGGISSIAWDCAGLPGGVGDFCDALRTAGVLNSSGFQKLVKGLRGSGKNAGGPHQIPAGETAKLATRHYTQVTILGVDIFHPQSGEVRSSGPDGIACWFIDTDYNKESFFVRHAYFTGQNDPYKALKTSLKAEIDEEAWESLNSTTSRPFPKPEGGFIAIKVINHLGDEVMKVYEVLA